MIHYPKKSHLKRKQKTRRNKKALATGGASKFGGKDLFGGKNPFASRRQEISSDEDAADAELEDGPITASNNTTNGSGGILPPPHHHLWKFSNLVKRSEACLAILSSWSLMSSILPLSQPVHTATNTTIKSDKSKAYFG